jgi:anti-sigma factor RsiW
MSEPTSLEPTSHEPIEALLGAYVVDAVDADERLMIEDHLHECPRCRQEVAELREVTALLAHGGAPAPEGLWDKIAAALEETPPPMRLELRPPGEDAPTTRGASVVSLAARRRRKILLGVIGAAAAIVIALLGLQVRDQRQRLDDLEASAASTSMEQAATAALSEPDARLARLKNESGDVQAVAVMKPDGTGYLLGSSLPPVGDHVYQLWGATTSGNVISLGVIHRPGVFAFSGDSTVETLMITEEDKPVDVSHNPAVVSGSLA